MKLTAKLLTKYCDSLLNSAKYHDACVNGLQVDATLDNTIKKIAYSVDAGESVIDMAVQSGADLLLTHHALIWGNGEKTVTDIFGRKINKLIRNSCSLVSYHLPLDGDLKFGNGVGINNWLKSKKLGLNNIKGFGLHEGSFVGLKGTLSKEVSRDKFLDTLINFPRSVHQTFLPFGKEKIKSVGIVTGSGGFAIEEAANSGIDLLISGEPKQSIYHLAKELNQNAAFLGHYATETFGVELLAKHLSKKFGLEIVFIDEPTGI